MNIALLRYPDKYLVDKLVEFIIFYPKKNKATLPVKKRVAFAKKELEKILNTITISNVTFNSIECLLNLVSNFSVFKLAQLNKVWRERARMITYQRNLEYIKKKGLAHFTKGIAVTLLQNSTPDTKLTFENNGEQFSAIIKNKKLHFIDYITQKQTLELLSSIHTRWKFSIIGKKARILNELGMDKMGYIDCIKISTENWLAFCSKYIIIATFI